MKEGDSFQRQVHVRVTQIHLNNVAVKKTLVRNILLHFHILGRSNEEAVID